MQESHAFMLVLLKFVHKFQNKYQSCSAGIIHAPADLPASEEMKECSLQGDTHTTARAHLCKTPSIAKTKAMHCQRY